MSTRPVKVPDASHPISVTATGQPVTVSVDGHVVARTDAALSTTQLANQRLTGAQDLAWAIINNPSFLFNR